MSTPQVTHKGNERNQGCLKLETYTQPKHSYATRQASFITNSSRKSKEGTFSCWGMTGIKPLPPEPAGDWTPLFALANYAKGSVLMLPYPIALIINKKPDSILSPLCLYFPLALFSLDSASAQERSTCAHAVRLSASTQSP